MSASGPLVMILRPVILIVWICRIWYYKIQIYEFLGFQINAAIFSFYNGLILICVQVAGT